MKSYGVMCHMIRHGHSRGKENRKDKFNKALKQSEIWSFLSNFDNFYCKGNCIGNCIGKLSPHTHMQT